MSKANQIQNAIRELSGGSYQKLMDAYLYKRFDFKNIMQLGSHTGTDKTTKGTPDSYVLSDTGKFILIAYGTVIEKPYTKIEEDVLSCLDESKTGINIEDIEQIICCHTSTNITPGQFKQIGSHYKNTLLIGLGELALDLCFKYPAIAKEYLSIEIDTHQIFDKDDYIEYTSRNTYSTSHDTPLLCREKEIEELTPIIDLNAVTIICGKSGIGKTRLALEIAECYGASNNYTVKIIKSNNEPIYDDIQITFTDDKDFLVVVDDANQLIQLKHLLDLCVSNQRIHRFKILLTVRDYARDYLFQKVRDVLNPAIYVLKPLLDDNIKLILSENIGIKNEIYIKQIQQIAKGSIRLAIMAGKCAIKGSFKSIKNAFDIFDNYFAETINRMDRNEIIIATIIALFDSLTLESKEKPIQLAAENGIEFEEFKKTCEDLHHKEIVSIFNNMAVKFEDQNLRDYLLYYVFFKTKWITPSYIIYNAFPDYRKQIVYAFNTLVRLFDTKENLNYIADEIKRAWVKIKIQSNDNVLQFVETFGSVIQDEALLIIKQEIDRMPEEHIDFGSYDFDKTSNNHIINSKLLKMLIGFKYTRCYEEALEIALYYLEHNTKYPMDYYFFFGSDLGFEHESYQYNFEHEYLLVRKLFEYYEERRTVEAALCLSFCISNCLKYHFSDTESNPNNTITFIQFGLPSCKEVFQIRFLCFKALSILYSDDRYRKFSIKILMNYSKQIDLESDKKILEQDMIAFSTYFSNLLDIDNFESCLIKHHLHTICDWHNVSYPEILLSYENNQIFMIYLTIKNDKLLLYENFDEAEVNRRKDISELCQNVTDEEFNRLWETLEKYDYNLPDQWNISTGIGLVFESLDNENNRFLTIVKSYLQHNTPFGDAYPSISLKLIELLGYSAALDYVNNNEFTNKRKWLANIYDNIPESKIEKDTSEFFIEKLVEQKDEKSVCTLSISTVLKVNKLYPGFVVRYVKSLNEICEKQPWVVSSFMNKLDLRNSKQIREFVINFNDSIKVLQSTYLNALHGRQYFDYRGQLLIQIIRRDTSFISTIIKDILLNESTNLNENILNILWDEDNYLELVTFAMDEIKKNIEPFYSYNTLGEHILITNKDETKRWPRKKSWIRDYIIRNNTDNDSMKFIFEIICNLTYEHIKDSILLFCQYNNSYSDFTKLPLLPNGYTWSGSEVPLLEKQIEFLINVKNELNGFAYIEHKAYLAERIQCIQKKKENVLLREFIEDR